MRLLLARNIQRHGDLTAHILCFRTLNAENVVVVEHISTIYTCRNKTQDLTAWLKPSVANERQSAVEGTHQGNN